LEICGKDLFAMVLNELKQTLRQARYFCGIDVAKDNHVACILDKDAVPLVRSQSFANDAAGFARLREQLDKAGGPRRVAIAMEATGHYWYSLHDFLVGHGYPVAVLNPIQTAMQAKKGIRKTQTDRIDAGHIATLLKNGDYKPALVPGDLALTCRQLTRLRHVMVRQESRIRQWLWSRLHPVWPEYEPLFASPFCKTGRRLLERACTPAEIVAIPLEDLTTLIRKTSRGKFAGAKATEVRQAAESSVGTTRGLEAARTSIRLLLAQLEALEPIREQLEGQIRTLTEQLPRYILTLPGADPISAVSLYGETDPIDGFAGPSQLVAFAGLDLVVDQSGKYLAPRRHISKRGSPFLRRTLWHMAHRACLKEGDLRDYYLRRKAAGLKHLSAVTAVAIKLGHVTWRILTDRRDYLPQRPASSSQSNRPS
jgi:transposase